MQAFLFFLINPIHFFVILYMKKIASADVIDIYDYERHRDEYQRAYHQAKRGRVFSLGPSLLVIFHTFHTVLFQLQEFLRSQRVRGEPEIRSYLQTYNALIPEDGHLRATLQVGFSRKEDIRRLLYLPRQVANHHLWIQADSASVTGTPVSNDKSPVAFVDFSCPDTFIQKLGNESIDLILRSLLPEYEHSLTLNSEAHQAMLTDLS